MYTVIVLPGGRQIDALLLSATQDRLRVIMPGRTDTVEFQLIEGNWTSETGELVELGAIIAGSSTATARVLSQARPRTLAAS